MMLRKTITTCFRYDWSKLAGNTRSPRQHKHSKLSKEECRTLKERDICLKLQKIDAIDQRMYVLCMMLPLNIFTSSPHFLQRKTHYILHIVNCKEFSPAKNLTCQSSPALAKLNLRSY